MSGIATETTSTDHSLALVVDNESCLLQLMSRLLKRRDLRTETATSIAEARALVGAGGPDRWKLFIIDLHLTDGDGADFCEWLREAGVPPSTPIVLCTGSVSPGLEEQVGKRGVTAVVRKPFQLDAFMRLIDDSVPSSHPGELLSRSARAS